MFKFLNFFREHTNSLLFGYFGLGFLEIIAEFYGDSLFIYLLKPSLIPVLALLYWTTSKEKNSYFLWALFFIFLANIFFISKDSTSILIASIFFLIHRAIIIYVVSEKVEIRNFLPVFLGSIPFGAAFIYLTFLTMDALGNGLYVYFIQVVFLSFLGGLSLSNYMVDPSKKNFWLLLNVVLFALIQFILILKIYYVSIALFQPIAMLFYVVAQYAIYRFMILAENED